MPRNFDVLCPTTKEICPARVTINDLFLGNEDNPQIDHDTRTKDRIKGEARNAEILGWAALLPCAGVTELGACPTREAMNASEVRQSLVSKIRTAVKHLRLN